MIEKIKILEIVNAALEGSDKFLVNLKVTPDNRIYVDIDGDEGVTIDDCIALSRAVESQLNRDDEDFAIDVSSSGADQPLKLTRQYKKNIGRDVEVDMNDGEHIEGDLVYADEATIKVRVHATKKRAAEEMMLMRRDVKSVRVAIKF